MSRLFLICLAGAAGTGARYAIGVWSVRRFGPEFPYGTIAINLAGCFLIAAIVQIATAQGWSDTARLTLTIGFLGGFTTYSSFNQETLRLAAGGAIGAASLNLLLTLFGGIALGVLGFLFARLLTDR